jgi:hypothetical protein
MDPSTFLNPESLEAEILALALEDVELVEAASIEERAELLAEYWLMNLRELTPSAAGHLRALYDAAVADGLDLPYERRGEVSQARTSRVALVLAGGARD